ncbi:MAG TPA: histidine kinase [Stenotrophomonas sp.]|nr:histidine kinase [Stenotrophomonas sp.]
MSEFEPVIRAPGPLGRRMPGSWRDNLAQAAFVALVCFALESVATWLWARTLEPPAFCVASPLLLAWWLTRPARAWLAVLLGAITGLWLALLGAGAFSAGTALLLALGAPLPPLALTWLARWRGVRGWPPTRFGAAAVLLLAIGVVVPLLQLLWAALWDPRFDLAQRGAFLEPLLTQTAGYLLLLPIALAWLQPEPRVHRGHVARDFGVALALGLLPLWAWSPVADVGHWPSALLTLFATPLLLWTLLRFGIAGACVALLGCGVAGVAYTLRGAGPFAALPDAAALLAMQAWLCAIACASWLIALMLEQQRRAAQQLRDAYGQLSSLTGRILVVQEQERTRIARDLHDDINQSLAALSIRLSYLKRQVGAAQREAVAELQQDLLKVSNDIRNISHGLHPAMLRFTGLASALSGFCQGHAQRSTLHIHCNVQPPDGLSEADELSLFRIVQEALNNVEKHAHAREAWVELNCVHDQCVLSVLDDGIGLPARASAPGWD